MKGTLSAFIAGAIFGIGLIVSEMVNPVRVIGFLDLAGNWDPTLAFVMGGALLVTAIGYKIVLGQPGPVFSAEFELPKNKIIDRKLIIGAAMFGIGWGLSGFCPGPALVGLGTLKPDILLFVISMIAGIKLFEWFGERRAG
ncbi:MAG: YeeE/YedE family protein [Gammaproteobacteria bacterium]|nr:YeeE/YedE family protein [Gammaproteobacteria bacterium]NND38974.1 YeeE/YedE family protein [Pseudomonadales bacterium]NNL11578.1 YeeE/YedE family protein [Pseudomonadales bacterium]NNM10962.1 YeeE/YedE family protein [Pseudomonadales bacterium]RZV60103.1 MAG: YeeE/YedE family protein [Pseudomonadales bacterium]